jgi:hypothetical protein
MDSAEAAFALALEHLLVLAVFSLDQVNHTEIFQYE